ncbi:MAG: FAD-dependent oxidoreductase [Opitutaceae bacterium]
MEKYDVVIIGCGMSGLAAGIRLAHFGRNVCIFERHNAPGGLNSFYSIDGRRFDVGLHAMTNFVRPGVRGTALGKLLRQLRIGREELDLAEQRRSRVSFSGVELCFDNDPSLLESEVADRFPAEIDGYRRLVEAIRSHDDTDLGAKEASARETISGFLGDPLLIDMLLCPLMFYGSASEHDMDWTQFVTMAKSIYLEGFCRPFEGVRLVIRILLDRYRRAGGHRRMKCGVRRLVTSGGRVQRLILDSGEEIEARQVISSIGLPETRALLGEAPTMTLKGVPGRLSFVETMSIYREPTENLGWGEDTVVFFNQGERFHYAAPEDLVDPRSGVICFPNNFRYGDRVPEEGIFRVTSLANPQGWMALPEDAYRAAKTEWFDRVQRSARGFLLAPDRDLSGVTIATDMFTPRTIRRFTGHINGAVYGSPDKLRDGRTPWSNLFLCGTDQGFLGIVGALLSGISMANLHVLSSGAGAE